MLAGPFNPPPRNNRTLFASGLRAATHGDSIASLGIALTAGINTDISQNGIWGWLDVLLGGRLNWVWCGGIGGQSSTQIAATARVAQTIAAKPSIIFEIAGTNDLGASISAAAIYANRVIVQDAFLRAGIPVVALTLPPRTSLTTAQSIQLQLLNDMIRRRCAVTPGLILGDIAAPVTHPNTGAWMVRTDYGTLDALTTDGVHFNATGGALAAKVLADAVSSVTPPVPWRLPQGGTTNLDYGYDGTTVWPNGNMVVNGKMLAGATTATSWTSNGAVPAAGGGTNTLSKVQIAGGLEFGEWQQVAMTAGTSGNNGQQFLFQEVATTLYSVGTQLAASCRFETDAANWTAADGLSNNAISLEIDATDVSFATLARARVFPNLGATNGRYRPLNGVLKTPLFTVPSGAVHLNVWLRFFGVGTYRVTDVQARKSLVSPVAYGT